jgi:solute carrier family 6 (neurotransmitter transporter, glycine) member 5/9
MLIFIGLPIFFLELTIAQYSKCGPLKVWKVSPLFKGLGMASVLTTTFVCIYYNVIIAYCVVFFVSSFFPKLPWVSCDNEWNDLTCLVNGANITKNASIVYQSPAYQYYYAQVLQISDGIDNPIGMNWKLVASLFVCWLLTFVSLSKGIQSLGKVSYVTAIFPYIMIIALIIRGVTLPGAMKGITYYIGSLDLSKLLRLKTWIDAASQVCFCLSLAEGGLITLGKHNKFHFNHMKTSIFVVLLDGFTGLLAGFAIFSVLGFMAEQVGIEVSELAVGGPGLSFIAYPEALSLMPFPWIWCILFFAMMITIGFGSLLSLAECVLDSFIFFLNIQKIKHRMIFRFAACMVFFLIGCSMATKGGYYLLVIIESYTTTIPIILMATLESVVLGWFYGVDRLKADIKLMLNIRLNMFWRICFAYITPVMAIVS